ncbi:MAG: hypothetical protein BGO82_14160 [Devosia sp. 67-54]|mgnify:FL=1|nr:MAG: hypothetical protein BGO82_14160 [Devosia sp. 67-54]
MRGFMDAIAPWDVGVLAIATDGFFKAITRKHPSGNTWALEWNRSYRLIGFFGELEPAKAVSDTLPSLSAKEVYRTERERLAYRSEVALRDEDDILFDVPPKSCNSDKPDSASYATCCDARRRAASDDSDLRSTTRGQARTETENPFPWMSEAMDLKKEKNFFVIEYQNGGALNWD